MNDDDGPVWLPPADQRRDFEHVAAVMAELLPMATVERTADCIQLSSDEPIVILLTPEAVELRISGTAWPHPNIPVATSRLWRRVLLDDVVPDLEIEASDMRDRLSTLLISLQQARRDQLQRCVHCGLLFPPDRTVESKGRVRCHECAEREEGIVF